MSKTRKYVHDDGRLKYVHLFGPTQRAGWPCVVRVPKWVVWANFGPSVLASMQKKSTSKPRTCSVKENPGDPEHHWRVSSEYQQRWVSPRLLDIQVP